MRIRHGLTLLGGSLALALPVLGMLAPAPGIAQDQPAGAAAPSAQPQPDSAQPDSAHGQAIALGEVKSGSGQPGFPCYTCHGRNGEGAQQAGYPRLAGQSYAYLYAQLRAFATGKRQNATMQQVVATLDDQAMRDVAAYFATRAATGDVQAAAAEAKDRPDAATLAAGGMLAAYGDMTRGIQACGNCHGPKGAGEPPTYPYLGGQYADYIAAQLEAFRSGARQGGPLGIMHDIAGRLTDTQIHAVAEYYAAIRPAAPAPQTEGKSGLMPPPATPQAEGNGSAHPAPPSATAGRRAMKPLALALLMLLAAPPVAAAASPQSSQSQTVEVGAGTTDGTTTGSSGPQKSGPSGPNQPSASLCDDYQGETKASCLSVEMHKAPPDKGEAQ